MATVYLAHDIKHDRNVAIKILREELSASLGGDRFLREIRIAAQLQHPNILPLLDSGAEHGLLFYVMPYVSGQSLRERITREGASRARAHHARGRITREGALPVHEAVRLITEVVDALAHAHELGVVHCGHVNMPAAWSSSNKSSRTNNRSTARRNASVNRAVSCTGHPTNVPSGRKPPLVTSRWRCGCQFASDPCVCRHATIPTVSSRSPVSVRMAAVTGRAATRAISPSRRRR